MKRNKTKENKSSGLMIFIILILVSGFAYFIYNQIFYKVEVPQITGMNLSHARDIAKSAGLKLVIQDKVYSDQYDRDIIISQNPVKGIRLNKFDAVYVKVSKGTYFVEIPSLVGLYSDQAINKLKESGLKFTIKKIRSTQKPDIVISQEPKAGSKVKPQVAVTVFIGLLPDTDLIRVPNVIKMNINKAKSLISGINLKYQLEKFIPSGKIPENVIISQKPFPEKPVKEGTVIKLTISSGFKNLKAPNIIGLSIPEAKEELNDFGIDLVIKHGSANDGVAITSQNPPAGSLLKKAVIEVEFSRTTIVPDILGLKLNDAVKKIEESNLKVGRKEFVETNMAQSGTVLDQNPKADLEIIVSSPVNLVIAK